MKPVISLSLIPSTRSFPFRDGIHTVRVDGTDVWMAKLSYCTGQGQHTQKTFTSFNRQEVLYKAYDCLQELTRDQWFAKFQQEQLAIYSPYFKEVEGVEALFYESISKVYLGKCTRERFVGIWEDRIKLYKEAKSHQITVHVADSATWGTYDPRMDERCDPVDTKRWWQFWK